MRKKKKLQIENCKLKIANCRMGHRGRFGQRLPSAEILRPAYPADSRGWLAFPIFNFQFSIFNLQFFFLLLLGTLAFAADPPPSTDDQLRDSLNSKAGDDYDRELLGEPTKPDGKSRVDEEMQKKLQKELGPAAQKEGKAKADPLLQIAKEMREVPPRLDNRDSGAETQFLQRQIASDLAKLIEQAKKSGCPGGKCSTVRKTTGSGDKKSAQNPGQPSENSRTPAQESEAKLRKPEAIRAAAAKEVVERMLEPFRTTLPSHDRERMLESPGECFLPEYELEIEDYFRRLSEDYPNARRP
jgi:hypothetical protein